jgi:hypothetical protein
MSTTTEPDPMADILRLAEHLGARNIRARSGCWEAAVDDTWWVALNPHEHDCRCSRGPEVPAFVAYVEYNGWPAGHVSLLGDGWFAAGDGANPETFAAAVRTRIARQEAPA